MKEEKKENMYLLKAVREKHFVKLCSWSEICIQVMQSLIACPSSSGPGTWVRAAEGNKFNFVTEYEWKTGFMGDF